MTQQDDITQRVLTAEHHLNELMRLTQPWPNATIPCATVRSHVEQALSQVRAPVADERQAVAYLDLGTGGYMDVGTDLTDEQLTALPKGRHMLAIIGTHSVNGYTPVSAPIADERAVETFAERFALALKPVAYTTKRGAVYLGKSTQVGSENLCTISQAVYEFRAALASAPVAGEAQSEVAKLAEELGDLASDMAYEANQEMDQEKATRAAIIERGERALRRFADAAPQASAEYERGRADGWAAGWDQAIKQPQAHKDGGQQRAGDMDERAAFEAWAYRAGMGPKFRESMFAAWEARASLSATQAEQGERD
ncbi:hypothetical protein [Achromobacter sp. CSND-B12]|uniref:hypothetical protein n=1 Tax=Achromobacter sp. CSND-B12 TaxID=3462570 RepID=UPI00406A197A